MQRPFIHTYWVNALAFGRANWTYLAVAAATALPCVADAGPVYCPNSALKKLDHELRGRQESLRWLREEHVERIQTSRRKVRYLKIDRKSCDPLAKELKRSVLKGLPSTEWKQAAAAKLLKKAEKAKLAESRDKAISEIQKSVVASTEYFRAAHSKLKTSADRVRTDLKGRYPASDRLLLQIRMAESLTALDLFRSELKSLREQRQALISLCRTVAANPNLPNKDSARSLLMASLRPTSAPPKAAATAASPDSGDPTYLPSTLVRDALAKIENESIKPSTNSSATGTDSLSLPRVTDAGALSSLGPSPGSPQVSPTSSQQGEAGTVGSSTTPIDPNTLPSAVAEASATDGVPTYAVAPQDPAAASPVTAQAPGEASTLIPIAPIEATTFAADGLPASPIVPADAAGMQAPEQPFYAPVPVTLSDGTLWTPPAQFPAAGESFNTATAPMGENPSEVPIDSTLPVIPSADIPVNSDTDPSSLAEPPVAPAPEPAAAPIGAMDMGVANG